MIVAKTMISLHEVKLEIAHCTPNQEHLSMNLTQDTIAPISNFVLPSTLTAT